MSNVRMSNDLKGRRASTSGLKTKSGNPCRTKKICEIGSDPMAGGINVVKPDVPSTAGVGNFIPGIQKVGNPIKGGVCQRAGS